MRRSVVIGTPRVAGVERHSGCYTGAPSCARARETDPRRTPMDRLDPRPHTTLSGIGLDAVYGPADAERPGEYPYTRGPYASMYRQKLWTMRQFAGFGTAEDTNERFHALLAAGGNGLSTAFDMPTLL